MKLDRLLGILTILLQKDRVTAPELAKRFEVNRRTIGRDIDALCMAGIPVVAHQGSGGGFSIAEGFKLDKSVLTTDELSSMVAALKGIGSVSDNTNIERVLDKLHSNADAVVSLREPIIIDLASHYKGQLTDKIEQIKRAALCGQMIEFDYFYEKGEFHRRIEPYFVVFQWSAWYVFGFCLERSDFRMFKLQRLWNLRLCEEHFSPREIPAEKRDFNVWLAGEKEHKLVALFNPSEKHRLIETYGLDCFEETADGLHFEIGFTKREYILSWLLGFGGKVKVLEPDFIISDLKDAVQNILSRYE
ncbi:YafY family transcriptional regulator [Tyzzerella sp. OttesenSCG-928-J15]|nr:YafY family transcriptional regulator [Ruminococcaceae bacterium OttesenSCG-928-L11]MDL2248710.1 YafY family transcriptional regulator [Tyzzerella sp. OttesenSCG-928-J15]